MRWQSVVVILLAGFGPPVRAQSDGPDPIQQRAAAAYRANDWATASTAYAELVKRTPGSASFRFRLGIALLRSGHPDLALTHLTEAERLGVPPFQAAFALGKAHAALGHRDAAFRELDRSAAAGYTGTMPPLTEDDPDLKALRDDARYRAFVTAVDRNARPCRHDPRYREFDWWIGEWDVRPNGQPDSPASTNIIRLEHDGCIIHENWTGQGGSTGQSFNMYDWTYGVWRQTWVDQAGDQHDYRGGIVDGKMVFTADLPPPRGQTGRIHTRLTFTRIGPDTIRQFSEQTMDRGKTWQVNYDFIYTRRTR